MWSSTSKISVKGFKLIYFKYKKCLEPVSLNFLRVKSCAGATKFSIEPINCFKNGREFKMKSDFWQLFSQNKEPELR